MPQQIMLKLLQSFFTLKPAWVGILLNDRMYTKLPAGINLKLPFQYNWLDAQDSFISSFFIGEPLY